MNRPTLETWMQPPHTRWSFRHVRELIPSARVRRGDRVRVLEADDTPALLDVVVEGTDSTFTVGERLAHSEADSFTVLHGNSLVLEWRASGIRDDEQHLMFSVTKSVTSLLCGALTGAGLINVDAPVTHYVPEIAGSGFAGCTVRNLLDMTAAFRFVEDYSPGPDVTAYRHAAGWYPAPFDTPGLRAFLSSRESDGPHGDHFRYLSPTTDLLGWICEAVTDLPYADALSQYIWAPMGAEADAEITLDRAGSPRAAGGLSATPRDMARLGLIVARGGEGIVPRAYVDDLTHNGSTEQWARGDFAPWLPGGAYRSCWYQPRVDPDAIMAVGIHGQMIYVDRARQVVVVTQSSWSIPDDTVMHNDSYLTSRAIARALA